MRNISEDSISYIRDFDSSKTEPQFSDIGAYKIGRSQKTLVAQSQKRCLQKFVHLCMIDGKKTIASNILQATLYQLADHGDGISYLMKAIDNVKPILEVKKVRIAGSTQLVPSVISKNRQETLAIRWILEAAMIQKRRKGSTKVFSRKRQNRTQRLDQCLAAEIVDAYNKTGTVRKKRDELHKLAEANRGFSHYRWW
jgi:small subunit ribosomal protein S7